MLYHNLQNTWIKALSAIVFFVGIPALQGSSLLVKGCGAISSLNPMHGMQRTWACPRSTQLLLRRQVSFLQRASVLTKSHNALRLWTMPLGTQRKWAHYARSTFPMSPMFRRWCCNSLWHNDILAMKRDQQVFVVPVGADKACQENKMAVSLPVSLQKQIVLSMLDKTGQFAKYLNNDSRAIWLATRYLTAMESYDFSLTRSVLCSHDDLTIFYRAKEISNPASSCKRCQDQLLLPWSPVDLGMEDEMVRGTLDKARRFAKYLQNGQDKVLLAMQYLPEEKSNEFRQVLDALSSRGDSDTLNTALQQEIIQGIFAQARMTAQLLASDIDILWCYIQHLPPSEAYDFVRETAKLSAENWKEEYHTEDLCLVHCTKNTPI